MSSKHAPALSPVWLALIAEWSSHLQAAALSPNTTRARLEHMNHLARRGPWDSPHDVTAPDLIRWFASQTWAVETRRGRRNTYRAFWRWLIDTGRADTSPAAALPVVRTTTPLPRPIPEDALTAAKAAAQDDRVLVILRLAAELGLRRAEIARIHDRDIFQDLSGWSLLVHGKGSKQRIVPLSPALALMVRARTARHGYLLPGNDNGHLSARYVGKLAARALPGDWTLHTLRHRFATRAYKHNRDVFTVQRLLGHSSPVPTQRYVMLDTDTLRDTAMAAA
ncbi:tyrosine-type recombinase/integrase [Dermabacteraceae bacterium P13138]